MSVVKRKKEQRTRKENEPAQLAGWGARIETCYLQIQALTRHRLTLDAFGALVATTEGREGPYRKNTVKGWTGEKREPRIATLGAIASLAECEPWWIAWGVGKGPANVIDKETTGESRSRSAKREAK